jgi:outer membrane receptor for ferrienterochelin and colicins
LRTYHESIDVVNRRTEGVPVNPPQQVEDLVLEGQARMTLGAHGIVGGFEARNESLEDPGLPGARSLAQHRALFVQDELALTPAFNLTLGLRHDRHQLFGDEWSPRLYGVWRVGEAWSVKGGYGHGFKAPNLKQIVPGARAEGPNTFYGNPDLQPERSDSVELGAGHAAGPTQAQVMLFAQRVEDLIEVRLLKAGTVPGVGTYTYENLARARMSGLETSLAQVLGAGFTTQLSYTYLDARTDTGQRLEKRPRHSATLQVEWDGDPWRAGAYAEYSGDQLLPSLTAGAPAETAPGFTLVGAHVTRTLPWGLELTLGVKNLGNVSLAELSPLYTHVEPPRTWRLTLRGRW